jgi:hypothetical protein
MISLNRGRVTHGGDRRAGVIPPSSSSTSEDSGLVGYPAPSPLQPRGPHSRPTFSTSRCGHNSLPTSSHAEDPRQDHECDERMKLHKLLKMDLNRLTLVLVSPSLKGAGPA